METVISSWGELTLQQVFSHQSTYRLLAKVTPPSDRCFAPF
jgi:hypothetical protein